MTVHSRQPPRFIYRPLLQRKHIVSGLLIPILLIGIKVVFSLEISWLIPGLLIWGNIYLGILLAYTLITYSKRAQRFGWAIIQVICFIYVGSFSTIGAVLFYNSQGYSVKNMLIWGLVIGQGGWIAFIIARTIIKTLQTFRTREWTILLILLLAGLISAIWLVQGKSPIQIEIHVNALEICIDTPSYKPGVRFNPCVDIPFVWPPAKPKPTVIPQPTSVPQLTAVPQPTAVPPTAYPTPQPKESEATCNPNSVEPPVVRILNLDPAPLSLTLSGPSAQPPLTILGGGSMELVLLPGVYQVTSRHAYPNALPGNWLFTVQKGCSYTWSFWIVP